MNFKDYLLKEEKKNEDPVDKFIYNVQLSIKLCKKLLKHMQNHYNVHPDKVNWSHVGTSMKVKKELEEIVKFLNIK